MSRFVYAFAFLLLASTVSANHNLTMTVYPLVNDCGSAATATNTTTESVAIPNFNVTKTDPLCNVYGIDNTTANNFNFTATCSSTGVLTIQMFFSGDCTNNTTIQPASFSSNAVDPKCNIIPPGVIGNTNPASIFVPFCTPAAAPTNSPNNTNPNATNPTNPPTTGAPTTPTNTTNPPPRGVAAQQAGVSAALMAAAAAVIVIALF